MKPLSIKNVKVTSTDIVETSLKKPTLPIKKIYTPPIITILESINNLTNMPTGSGTTVPTMPP